MMKKRLFAAVLLTLMSIGVPLQAADNTAAIEALTTQVATLTSAVIKLTEHNTQSSLSPEQIAMIVEKAVGALEYKMRNNNNESNDNKGWFNCFATFGSIGGMLTQGLTWCSKHKLISGTLGGLATTASIAAFARYQYNTNEEFREKINTIVTDLKTVDGTLNRLGAELLTRLMGVEHRLDGLEAGQVETNAKLSTIEKNQITMMQHMGLQPESPAASSSSTSYSTEEARKKEANVLMDRIREEAQTEAEDAVKNNKSSWFTTWPSLPTTLKFWQ